MPLSESRPPLPLPLGKLRQTITYLEMTAPPPSLGVGSMHPRLGASAQLSPEAYRALYRAVGERWLWWERLVLADAELAVILDDPRVEIRLLRVDGETAGYCEIDRRSQDGTSDDSAEIAFLGLKPAFTGRGLGPVLLAGTLCAAWTRVGANRARRVWLHTCDHDHPRALGLYCSAGFRIVRLETVLIDDPRRRGLLPLSAAPHVPLATAPET